MTTDDDLDPRDALASAHLDGLTTAEEAAAIAADPDLRARVAAMEAVRAALRQPVPIDEAERERTIAAALRTLDARGPELAPVSDLAVVAARRRLPSRTRRIVGIAAVIALLALAVPLIAQVGDGGDEDLATSSDESSEAARDAVEESALGDAAPGAGTTADAFAAEDGAGAGGDGQVQRVDAGDLGDFADAGALATAVRSRLADEDLQRSAPSPASPTTAAAQAEAAIGCAGTATGADEPGSSLVLSGTAQLDGRAVAVTVVQRPDGRRTVTAADLATCEPVAVADLAP